MKIKIVKVNEEEAYKYAELKIQIWNTCYNKILPKEYLDNISVCQKAKKYQNEIIYDSSVVYYFILASTTPIGVLRLNFFKNTVLENGICINDLYLLKEYQNKGYGGIIFNFILKEALKNNCRFITAWIIEKNMIVRNIIEKLGFKQTSHKQIHYKTMITLLEYCYDLYDRPKLLIR